MRSLQIRPLPPRLLRRQRAALARPRVSFLRCRPRRRGFIDEDCASKAAQTRRHARRPQKFLVYDTFNKYLATITAAVKKHDPNHLTLGIRLGGEVPDEVISACKIFDVCSINVYDWSIDPKFLDKVATLTGRPIIVGEFHFGTPGQERERGITIKLNAVRMNYHAPGGEIYELNLIDTPGHVDFTYEVSRSLAASEGAILVVDASQGVQAQTLSNLFLALDAGLEIIPVLNKIDLPGAEPDRRAQELHDLIGARPEEILRISAKEGTGVPELLEAIVKRVPPPKGDPAAPVRALIFDSYYDRFRGAIPSIRVVDGVLQAGMRIVFGAHKADQYQIDEVGYLQLGHKPVEQLAAGEVGYVVANVRGVQETRPGDTILDAEHTDAPLLPGYRDIQSMVFAGLYPTNAEQYEELRDALEKLQLNDASLHYEPESSVALGFGFRCGFLGLLHMEIVRERLEREFDLDLISTVPNVEYHVYKTDGVRELGRESVPDAARIGGGAD